LHVDFWEVKTSAPQVTVNDVIIFEKMHHNSFSFRSAHRLVPLDKPASGPSHSQNRLVQSPNDSPIDESSRLLFLSMGIVRHFANDSIACYPSLLVKPVARRAHRALQYPSRRQEGSSSSPFVHSFGGQTHPYGADHATLRLRIIQPGLQTKVK